MSGDLGRFVVQNDQLPGSQGQSSVSAPIVVAEFDLENVVRERLDHGSHLPAIETSPRQILIQGHDVEEFYFVAHSRDFISDNMTTRQPREVFTSTNYPVATHHRTSSHPDHLEIQRVPLSVLILLREARFPLAGCRQQRIPQLFGILDGQSESGCENTSFVPTP